jgi:RNA polymerase sigma factor (sigma-70 family)
VTPGSASGTEFSATHWTLVLAAARSDSTHAGEALAKLCRSYWSPLYLFVRRQGYTVHDAEDLTQAFFARLLEKKTVGQANPAKGKFRSFLIACLKHFLANEHDRASALKRGGRQEFISIDTQSAEARLSIDGAKNETAERLFERQWALAVLDQVMTRLREEFLGSGKDALFFDALTQTFTGSGETAHYAAIAAQFGTTESAVKSAAHRLRRRYRQLLRAEIASTVADPAEIDEELSYLMTALS